MTVNQQTVEETKKQIRALVNEIAALGKSGAPAEEYYPQFLQRVITALAAVGGAIWLLDQEKNLRLQYQINMTESLLEPEGEERGRHERLIRRAALSSQSLLVPPFSGTTEGQGEGNPTKYLLVLAPLQHDREVDGLIEVFQRPEAAPATQQGYLRFLQQMAELAGEWIKNERLAHFSDRQILWQQADNFARQAHESLDLKETAYIVANEGRRLIGCDRVSVAIQKGRHCRVMAISGQDTIENRSNIVSSLNKLASRVVAAGEPLWHDGTPEDLPPQIEEALEEYVDQSYGRHIAVLPLREPMRAGSQEPTGAAGAIDRDGAHRGETIGALIVEQIESNLPHDVFHTRVNLVYEHGTRAIANARSHNNLFLMPLWRTLGKLSWLVRAQTLPKTLAAAGALVIALLGLTFIPMEMELEANGTLEADKSAHVFAPFDGIVKIGPASLLEGGQKVTQGDLLFKLDNPELDLKIIELQGELDRAVQEQASVASQLSMVTKRDYDAVELTKLRGEEIRLQTEIETLTESLALRKKQRDELQVVAPINGVVTTWNLKKMLDNRPVVTGQVLLDIADLSQPLHLLLRMPDKRMSYLEQRLARWQSGDEPLHVDFILASQPDTTYYGFLDHGSIEKRSHNDKDEGLVVRMKVKPDAAFFEALRALGGAAAQGDGNADKDLRLGAKVIADVHVGKRASGYVLGHEVYEWLCKFFF